MFKDFNHIEDLIKEVEADKSMIGSFASIANRYPIRFILFDNFRDSFDFVTEMQGRFKCFVESVNNWMESDFEDKIITHSRLATEIIEFTRNHSKNDSVIAPFSELARFYDNKANYEFNTLIATIKAIETSSDGFTNRQRVYIPIVGLEGKMSKFNQDAQIFIWYFKNGDRQLNYKLILSNKSTFDVQGLECDYTVVKNMRDWLGIWRDRNAKQNIISTSSSLYANALFAQPDNAFSFCVCDNVYEFLTKGLNLDFRTIKFKEDDVCYWLRLAKEIDLINFSFDKFFNKYFHIDELADVNVFLKTWFECKDNFEKWLLSQYYEYKFCNEGYICKVLSTLKGFTNNDFFTSVAMSIFSFEENAEYLKERDLCLQVAKSKQIKLTNEIQNDLVEQLQFIAIKNGYSTAIKYFSPLTLAEKRLAIHWLKDGHIFEDQIRGFFPELFNYLGKSYGTNDLIIHWVQNYFEEYKKCKLRNAYSENIENLINEINSSTLNFNQWYHCFKTVKTVLFSRSDIDVYYWIDGLGIDWIPFILELIKSRDNIFINEVYIARCNYPSVTSVNKPMLLDLSSTSLYKIGDLDSYTHQQGNKYPYSILDEMDIVTEAITKILNDFGGKKIAIVSDHGLTSLSQMREGLNMAGVESDHSGRVAFRKSGKSVSDNNYILLDDNITMCALRHESLCSKIPTGQGAHGGCTPEEILVPVIIISSHQDANSYSIKLLTKVISGANPIAMFEIKGNSINDIPYIKYNNRRYELYQHSLNVYCTDRLSLMENVYEIVLYIGSFSFSSKIIFSLGAEEEDLFDI